MNIFKQIREKLLLQQITPNKHGDNIRDWQVGYNQAIKDACKIIKSYEQ